MQLLLLTLLIGLAVALAPGRNRWNENEDTDDRNAVNSGRDWEWNGKNLVLEKEGSGWPWDGSNSGAQNKPGRFLKQNLCRSNIECCCGRICHNGSCTAMGPEK